MRGIGRIRNTYRSLQAGQTHFRKAFWQQFNNPNYESRPIFLIGCGRSGTSMMIKQLDKSWQIKLYNEDHPAAFDTFRLRDLDTIERLIRRSQAPAVLFKPLLDTCQAQVLLSRFPDAKLIFAFRHYDDVINSSLKRFGVNNHIDNVRRWIETNFSYFSVAPPPESTTRLIQKYWHSSLTPESGAALYWLFYNQLFFDLNLEQNGRVILMHYETLVQKPQQQMKTLANFLDIQFEKKMFKGIFASSIKRDSKPIIEEPIRQVCEALYQKLVSRFFEYDLVIVKMN